MKFQSNRIITSDIRRSVAFYEKVLVVDAHWFTTDFAELSLNAFTLAIGSTQTLQLFGDDSPIHGDNSVIIMEFKVSDVDEEYLRIKDITEKIIQKPTTMPWGNRSLLFCDPDGNLLNFFTPVSPAAIQKFS
ncbi:VOC family protein [Sphingobacterium sp. HMA12]|uniref:VOC family protein n=1 Tax=Sphingobacterium sp. HMA12 TaxID=2050894 RepID=UPI000CEA3389|nr:VOC family protein [Sphingobacterium sp. HMA12]